MRTNRVSVKNMEVKVKFDGGCSFLIVAGNDRTGTYGGYLSLTEPQAREVMEQLQAHFGPAAELERRQACIAALQQALSAPEWDSDTLGDVGRIMHEYGFLLRHEEEGDDNVPLDKPSSQE